MTKLNLKIASIVLREIDENNSVIHTNKHKFIWYSRSEKTNRRVVEGDFRSFNGTKKQLKAFARKYVKPYKRGEYVLEVMATTGTFIFNK